MLITNDKLRDHVFEVRHKLFTRWQHRHQMLHGVSRRANGAVEIVLAPPPPYTACVQQLPKSGAWMLPAAERGEWMMIAPED